MQDMVDLLPQVRDRLARWPQRRAMLWYVGPGELSAQLVREYSGLKQTDMRENDHEEGDWSEPDREFDPRESPPLARVPLLTRLRYAIRPRS